MGSQMNSISPVSSVCFVEMWWLLISSTLELPWSEYLNQKYKYQSLQINICLKLPVFVVICLKNLDNFTKTCMILTQTWAIGLLLNSHTETCKLLWIFTLFLKNLVYKSYLHCTRSKLNKGKVWRIPLPKNLTRWPWPLTLKINRVPDSLKD
jgi:hypothetical protein